MSSKEAHYVTVQKRPATQAGKAVKACAEQHTNLQRLGDDLTADFALRMLTASLAPAGPGGLMCRHVRTSFQHSQPGPSL